MRLTVLGGSAAWPNPGQGCSSYLVTTPTTTVILDCGPDTLMELRRQCDYMSVDAIIISHVHSDHMLDLVPYRYGLLYGAEPLHRRIPIWLPPEGSVMLGRLAEALSGGGEPSETYWTTAFELHEYDPEGTLPIGDLTIRFAPTQHYLPCFAMRVEDERGRSLFYSADTGTIEPLFELSAHCDLALIEATIDQQPDGPRDIRGHLTPEEAGKLAATAGTALLVATHLWCERPDEVVVDAIASAYDGPIVIAKPGLSLDV